MGRTVGRYEIGAMTGEGGMAEVYRARDIETGQNRALKILKYECRSNEELIERFVREGKTTAALSHPNIVTVYEVGSLDRVPYVIMEMLEGQALNLRMHAGKPMLPAATLSIARQIASALDHAHSRGIIHLDLKPSNIMFAKDQTTAKISDFGIALDEGCVDKLPGLVQMIMATPRYMSPEQATGSHPDGRSDLFSLGVILFEMITGQKAFDADTLPLLIEQIQRKNPAAINKLAPDTPPGLQKIVEKLLQKKTAKRFHSAGALAVALAQEHRAAIQREEGRFD